LDGEDEELPKVPFDRYINVGIAEDAIVGDGRVVPLVGAEADPDPSPNPDPDPDPPPPTPECLITWPLSEDDEDVEEMDDECP
jgi:hypothetical protein